MSQLFGEVCSRFEVVGELIDRRIVTSDKMKDWKLHIFKMAAKGCTLEIRVTEEVYEAGAIKHPYRINGSITMEGTRTALIADQVAQLRTKSA